jgi:hypothetical protein
MHYLFLLLYRLQRSGTSSGGNPLETPSCNKGEHYDADKKDAFQMQPPGGVTGGGAAPVPEEPQQRGPQCFLVNSLLFTECFS